MLLDINRLSEIKTIHTRLYSLEKEREHLRSFTSIQMRIQEIDLEIDALREKLQDTMNMVCPITK